MHAEILCIEEDLFTVLTKMVPECRVYVVFSFFDRIEDGVLERAVDYRVAALVVQLESPGKVENLFTVFATVVS